LVAYHFGPAGFGDLRLGWKVIWGTIYGVPVTIAYVGSVLWTRGCGKYSASKNYTHWWGPSLFLLFLDFGSLLFLLLSRWDRPWLFYLGLPGPATLAVIIVLPPKPAPRP